MFFKQESFKDENQNYISVSEIRGLSTETKPTDCAVGSIFIECDTSKLYIFDGSDWNEW